MRMTYPNPICPVAIPIEYGDDISKSNMSRYSLQRGIGPGNENRWLESWNVDPASCSRNMPPSRSPPIGGRNLPKSKLHIRQTKIFEKHQEGNKGGMQEAQKSGFNQQIDVHGLEHLDVLRSRPGKRPLTLWRRRHRQGANLQRHGQSCLGGQWMSSSRMLQKRWRFLIASTKEGPPSTPSNRHRSILRDGKIGSPGRALQLVSDLSCCGLPPLSVEISYTRWKLFCLATINYSATPLQTV